MFISENNTATINFGKQLSRSLRGGDILCLYGDLGAGKTALTKGIAAGLGIKKEIKSPTFTLMNMYDLPRSQAARRLAHIDTYRLKNEQELIDIGALDYLGDLDTITVIEWPEKIDGLLKGKKIKKISIEHTEDGRRKIY